MDAYRTLGPNRRGPPVLRSRPRLRRRIPAGRGCGARPPHRVAGAPRASRRRLRRTVPGCAAVAPRPGSTPPGCSAPGGGPTRREARRNRPVGLSQCVEVDATRPGAPSPGPIRMRARRRTSSMAEAAPTTGSSASRGSVSAFPSTIGSLRAPRSVCVLARLLPYVLAPGPGCVARHRRPVPWKTKAWAAAHAFNRSCNETGQQGEYTNPADGDPGRATVGGRTCCLIRRHGERSPVAERSDPWRSIVTDNPDADGCADQ